MLCLAVLCVYSSGLCGDDPRAQPPKAELHEGTGYFLFLADSNLVDGRRLLELRDKIGLTRKQEEKIENLVLEQETFYIRSSAEIKIKEVRFAIFLRSGQRDRKEIETYIREISAGKTDLIVNHANYLLDLRDLLTPRQLEALRQIKTERKPVRRGNSRHLSDD